jgi:D-alanine-D-alanine ligase
VTLKVAVICGGPSSEADVSRKSADGVVAALRTAGHSVTRFELDASLASALLAANPDVVFPITHGTVGEDGCLQGLLEVLNLRYVGCGVLASALAADKPFSKLVWRTHGLPVTDELVVARHDDTSRAAKHARERLGAAVVVKPAHGGSSFGVHRITEEQPLDALQSALDQVLAEDEQALVEPLLRGLEITCGVLDLPPGPPQALPPTLIVPKLGEFYDFASKYAPGGSQHVCPAPLKPDTLASVQEYAVRAHRAIGARDLSRVDFFVDERQSPAQLTILEINTLPGMTATSLYPEASGVMGYPFPTLCDRLVTAAYARAVRPAPKVEPIPTRGLVTGSP